MKESELASLAIQLIDQVSIKAKDAEVVCAVKAWLESGPVTQFGPAALDDGEEPVLVAVEETDVG